ncbi:phosphonate ABC transporter periplasmic phosphonate-binding protein [Marinobacter santoriniensis NKSG1]|uniref:Phosphonate ABC transporter periplasmic phosphonate-binding protein n=2 Tax=Marinobacter santoriniensis TaxID=523742 RepID=M7DA38_9GAMM|nr:phosphonate ABC transporter periplasmic phosphonate-binding protein [Marinobacter santoriniensis NKSG1]
MRFRFLLIALSLMLIAAPAWSRSESLTFGIVPQESSSRLADQWTPLMRYLSTRLNRPVRFMTAPDIPTFEKRVLAGEYDIAYMNPYHYVVFSNTPGYQAIAKEGGKQIRGIVVVPESAPAEDLEDLDGMTVAFPAPAAFAATILVRAELERLGVSYQPRFVGSHESVYLNVQRGFAGAGGGVERTLAIAMRERLDGVRVLWRSPGYTPHAFAVHPDMDPVLMQTVQSLLVNLADTDEGRSLLDRAHLKPLVRAADSDWNDVRQLGLDFIKTSGAP